MLKSSAVHHYHDAQEKKIALCSMIIAVLCEDREVTRNEWCKDWYINEVRGEAIQLFNMNCELVMNQALQTICEHGQCPGHVLVLAFDVISEPFRFILSIGNNVCPSDIV